MITAKIFCMAIDGSKCQKCGFRVTEKKGTRWKGKGRTLEKIHGRVEQQDREKSLVRGEKDKEENGEGRSEKDGVNFSKGKEMWDAMALAVVLTLLGQS